MDNSSDTSPTATSEVETEHVRKELAAVKQEHRKTQAQLQETKADLEASQVHIQNLTSMFESFKSRRSVRYVLAGVGLTEPARRAIGKVKGAAPATTPELPATSPETVESDPATKTSPMELQAAFIHTITADRANAGESTSGPLVTIAIITRNGIHHMQRVLDGLKNRTSYENFEVVVVDNQSSDDTVALCRKSWPFDLRLIENDANQSFSQANNQALEIANGEYVLFLNNDIDPINPGWLGAMVDALVSDPTRGAAGALLIYPQPETGTPRNHVTPLTIQHRGIRFRIEDQVPKGYNVGHKEDPLSIAGDDITSYPGVTAACLLVRSEVLAEVGGFTGGYVYGTEDVDLSLKIRNAGHDVVTVAGAALFHYEFGTQDELSQRIKRVNRSWNRTLFLETWGPTLERLMAPERLEPQGFWSANETPTVAIARPKDDDAVRWDSYHTANELGEAMSNLGWNVTFAEKASDRSYEIDPSIDLVITHLDHVDVRRLPQRAKTVAWVRTSVERWLDQPWFDEFDVVVTTTEANAQLIRERSRHEPVLVPVATNPDRFAPQPLNVTYESDIAFTGPRWAVDGQLVNLVLIRPDEKFVMFGKGWDVAPRVQRYWRGPAEYDDLSTIYSSSKVVIDIADPSRPEYGPINSRVVNALSSGALVLTNDIEGSAQVFGGKLPTYTTRDELREQLDTYLQDDELRERTVNELAAIVRERHTYGQLAETVLDAVRDTTTRARVRLKIGAPTWAVAEQWGDTHFARHFASALAKNGFTCDIDVLDDWDAPNVQDADIVVHLRGLVPYVPKRGQVNVLWIISHPDDVSGAECDAYDLVLAASSTFVEKLRSLTSTPVEVMLQATSPRVFSPREPNPDLAADLLFVGNSRSVMRPSVEMAIEKGLPLQVYGSGWSDLIPPEYVVDEYFPNERLAELYSSAKLLLNDHWDDMREAGFLSNRLFDAMACGTVVVTDPVRGLAEVFPESLPQFDSAEALAEVVHTFLADDALRQSVASEGQARVLEQHTFDQRAIDFVELVRPLLASHRAAISL